MIELKNLSCSFDEKTIFENIDLNIPSHLNILGANGSGKSTLAKCLCKLINYSGDIFVDDINIQNIPLKELAKTISYIPTKLEIYDEYITVEEFVLLSRFSHKNSFLDYSQTDKKISKDSIDALNISHLVKHSVSSLSSGEQQLLSIASALAGGSKTIIFDEPTANLDPKNSKIIASHIKELKKSHKIILITHDLQLASFMDSTTVFIKDSSISVFEDGFFELDNLEKLYDVSFDSLAVKYD